MPGSSVTALNSDTAPVVYAVSMGKRGFGHLYLRGKIWWAKWYTDGRPHQESTKERSKTAAANWLKSRLGKPTAHRSKSERVLIKEILDDALEFYRTHRTRSYADFAKPTIKALKAKLGNYRADRITTAALEEYKAARIAEGRAAGTVNRELAMLRLAYRRAAKQTPPKVSSVPIFQLLPEAPPRQGFIEADQYAALLKELPEELRCLLTVAYYTGLRRSELLAMKWDQIDFGAKSIRLWQGTTKNDEGRVIKMSPEVLDALTRQRASDPEATRVFHRNGASITDFRGSWDAACERAGMKGLLFHDLRRSAIRNMVRAGVPERVAMRISGHKTRAVFDRYNVVDEADLADAAAKVGKYVKARKR